MPRRNNPRDKNRYLRRRRLYKEERQNLYRSDWREAPDGKRYCNYLEYRVARILIANRINFEYSKRFETIDIDGNLNHREVDFWLDEPIDVYWCDSTIQAIEVKSGQLTTKCWRQKEDLEYIGIRTFIVNPEIVGFWERHGFLRKF